MESTAIDTKIIEQLQALYSQEFKLVQHRSRDIHTLFGCIKLKRGYYYCPDCGKGLAPYDRASGLPKEQLSPGLAEACCMLTVDDSFEQTSRRIERIYGQKVSRNTVDRVVHQVGAEALKRLVFVAGGLQVWTA